MKPLLLLGSGGHAKVLLNSLRRQGRTIAGIIDPAYAKDTQRLGLSVLGGDDAVFGYAPEQVALVNSIGSLPNDSRLRTQLFRRFSEAGYAFASVIDADALIAIDSLLQAGVQIMAGVIVQPGCRIAENSIVNTGVIVEHDCLIGSHVHIAPGAVLSGGVELGDCVHVGTGALLIQNVTVGARSVIGAGAVVTQDVPDDCIVYPARSLVKSRNIK